MRLYVLPWLILIRVSKLALFGHVLGSLHLMENGIRAELKASQASGGLKLMVDLARGSKEKSPAEIIPEFLERLSDTPSSHPDHLATLLPRVMRWVLTEGNVMDLAKNHPYAADLLFLRRSTASLLPLRDGTGISLERLMPPHTVRTVSLDHSSVGNEHVVHQCNHLLAA